MSGGGLQPSVCPPPDANRRGLARGESSPNDLDRADHAEFVVQGADVAVRARCRERGPELSPKGYHRSAPRKPELTDWPGAVSVAWPGVACGSKPLGRNAPNGPPAGSVPKVTVCGNSGSRFDQVTVSPTCTVCVCGSNLTTASVATPGMSAPMPAVTAVRPERSAAPSPWPCNPTPRPMSRAASARPALSTRACVCRVGVPALCTWTTDFISLWTRHW